MIPRQLEKRIRSSLKKFPAVAIVGPRQVGKTTLAKTLSQTYFDLELEEERLRLDIRWQEYLAKNDLIILDEAQNFPDIFPKIRSAIDKVRKKNGRFLILGSVSPSLMKDVSEFLTGRIALLELSPFLITEFDHGVEDDLWLMGGYPDGGILNRDNFPQWQQNYLDLIAMRDLPVWGLPAQPPLTKRLFKMLAIAHGTVWNASQLGKSLGLSYHTINSYTDYLEYAFLIRKVRPFFVNIKKRFTKSPKIYWRDTGLLHSLLNVSRFDDLLSQPWVGYSWEGWVIEQILIFLNNNGIPFDGPYYLRTQDGAEIDLLLVISNRKWAFEIKLSSSPSRKDMDRLITAGNLINADQCVLISRSTDILQADKIIATNLPNLLGMLAKQK